MKVFGEFQREIQGVKRMPPIFNRKTVDFSNFFYFQQAVIRILTLQHHTL